MKFKQNSLLNTIKNIAPLGFILISFLRQGALLRQISLFASEYTHRPVGPDGFSIYLRFLELQSGTVPAEPDGNFPLFLYFLNFLHTVFQRSVEEVFVPYLAQIFLVLLTGAFTYKIGTRLFSKNVGILSCFAVLFYGRILNYALAYANAIPMLFFFTGAVYFFVAYQSIKLTRYLWAGSLFLALSAFGRGTTLTQIGVFVLWFFLLKMPVKKVIANFAVMLCIVGAIIALPILHNYRTYNQFVFINTNGAMNLFIGNNPESQGQFYVPPALYQSVLQGGTTYQEEILAYITQQPADWIALTAKKLAVFFIFPWWRVGYLSDPSPMWLVFWLAAMGISLLYAVKLFTPFRSILYLTIVGYAAPIIVFFVEERFRIPILPMLFIFVFAVAAEIGASVVNRLGLTNSARATLLFCGLWGAMGIYAVYPQQKMGQPIGEIHTPPIYAGLTIGQSFRSTCANLYRIDVKIRTNNPEISQQTTFHLKEGGFDGPELYAETLDTYNVRRANYTSFIFPNIPYSAGKRYTFFFDTAAIQSEENGLIVLVEPDVPVDTVPSGSALFNGQPMPGDLTFFAHCRSFLNW